MPFSSRHRVLTALLFALVALAALPAAAQTRVRVLRDQTTIWRPGFVVAATVVKAGTELEVAGRQGTWYVVYLPSPPGTRERGLVAEDAVQPIGGAPAARPRTGTAAPPQTTQPRGGFGQPAPRTPPARPTFVSTFRGFAQAGYGWQTAHESFNALFGHPGTIWFGGGAQYAFAGGLYVEGSVDVSHQTGTRVFVSNGEVFELGIDETVTMVPIMGTVGYRFARRGPIPYVGGGAGVLIYKESSEFADANENVKRNFAAYHVLGGVEFHTSRHFSTAVEAEYRRIHQDFIGGVSDAFDEHDLGDIVVRGKVLFGER